MVPRLAPGLTTSHTYTTAGSFVVLLTVTDNAGRKGTSAQSLTVKPATLSRRQFGFSVTFA